MEDSLCSVHDIGEGSCKTVNRYAFGKINFIV